MPKIRIERREQVIWVYEGEISSDEASRLRQLDRIGTDAEVIRVLEDIVVDGDLEGSPGPVEEVFDIVSCTIDGEKL